MLVIARKIGQTIRIGDDIEVTVSAIRGDQVRLAIQAPREIPILRTEIIGTPPNSANSPNGAEPCLNVPSVRS